MDSSTHLVLAINKAWLRLAQAYDAGGVGAKLGDLFPEAPAFLEDTLLGGGAVVRRAVPAIVPAAGAATWWDLELIPHPDVADTVIVTARDVTEHLLARRAAEDAQEALSATGVRLRLAQDATGIGSWEWDLASDTQAWSPEQFHIFGLDPARHAPPSFATYIDAIHPDDRASIVAAIDSGFQGAQGPQILEYRLTRADTGDERWIISLGRTVARRADGRPLRLIGVCIDVTDRRREHEALVASETRLRLAFQAAQMFAWDWNLRTNRVTWMDGLAKDVGLDDDGFGGTYDAFRALVHPDDLAQVEAAIGRALRGETPDYRAEFRMRRADGSWRTTLTRGAVSRDAQGLPLRMIGVDHDVTEQRAAEDALRDGERRLRLAMEIAGLGAFEADSATGRFLRDGTLSSVLGLPPHPTTIERGRWFEFVHRDDRQAVETAFQSAATGGAPFRTEFRIVRPDGTERILASRGVRSGSSRIFGVVQDVTEARNADRSLRERAMRFAGMFDGMLQLVGLLSPDGTVLKANRAVLDFAASPREQVIGRKIWETAWFAGTPGAAERVRRAVEIAAAGTFVRFEIELRGGSRTALFDFSVRPVRDADGTVILLVPEGRDMSDLASADGAISTAGARYRSLVHQLPLHAFTALTDGHNDFINRHWFEYSGQSAEEGLGFGWTDALHPDDRARTLAAWDAARTTRTPYQVEHRLRGADGSYRWFLTRAVSLPAEEPDGEARWFGGSVEISEIVAEREALARRAEALEERVQERTRSLADAAREIESEIRLRADVQASLLQARKLETLGLLTSSVAHDFNNVLAAIVGSYSLIRRRTRSDDVLDVVGHGELAAERARNLIRQLVTFVRRDNPVSETLDLASVLRDLENLLRHAVGDSVRCVFDIQPDAWSVLADSHQLGIALLNLAVNARDAMPDGGTVTISVRNVSGDDVPAALRPGQFVSIAVHDVGHGMTPEILARAQDAFFTTKPQGEGTGLGLPMVQEFARRCGGVVNIRSALGEGTTVEILLPRAAIVASTPERMAALREISAPAFALHGDATILLVEDDEQVRPITADTLRALGYTVVDAASAETATLLAHTVPRVDLLITDVGLAGQDGVALARSLRRERPGLPVLFMTGNRVPPELHDAAVLLKPFHDTTLAREVLTQLGREVRVDLRDAEPLLSRLRNSGMRAMLVAWHRTKAAGEGYPHPRHLDPFDFGMQANAFIVTLDRSDPPRFHYLSVGRALTDELAKRQGTALASADAAGDEVIGTLDGAYRRCLSTASPVYQTADYDFGDGAPLHFERLILPASEEGVTITHLVGIVLFSETIAERGSDGGENA